MESVAAFPWNGWQLCYGIGGSNGVEYAEQAFYVKCDAETNPPENREYGKVFTEIGLAPSFPAEFIVVRITHQANTTEAS